MSFPVINESKLSQENFFRSDDSFSKSEVLGGKLNFKPHLEENMNLFSKLHPQFE